MMLLLAASSGNISFEGCLSVLCVHLVSVGKTQRLLVSDSNGFLRHGSLSTGEGSGGWRRDRDHHTCIYISNIYRSESMNSTQIEGKQMWGFLWVAARDWLGVDNLLLIPMPLSILLICPICDDFGSVCSLEWEGLTWTRVWDFTNARRLFIHKLKTLQPYQARLYGYYIFIHEQK